MRITTLYAAAAGLTLLAIAPVSDQTSTLSVELRIQSDANTRAEDVMTYVRALTVGARGEVIAAQDYSLLLFDSTGKLLRKIGRKGQGPGEFEDVSSLGWFGDTLWVYDGTADRVSLFRNSGELIAVLEENPRAPTANRRTDILNRLAGKFTVVGRSSPGNDTVPAVTTIDSPDGRNVQVLSSVLWKQYWVNVRIGTYTVRVPQIYSDATMTAVPPSGEYVAVIERSAAVTATDSSVLVRRFRYDGQSLGMARIRIPLAPITSAGTDSMLRSLGRGFAGPRGGNRFTLEEFIRAVRSASDIPRVHPPVQVAIAGDDGSLWLRTPPGTENWLVVDQSGAVVHRVRLRADQRILHVTRDRIWVGENVAGADAAIVRYRVRS